MVVSKHDMNREVRYHEHLESEVLVIVYCDGHVNGPARLKN